MNDTESTTYKSFSDKNSIKQLSLAFATIFDTNDLIKLTESISMLDFNKPRDITKKYITLFTYNGTNSTTRVIIDDILMINKFPPVRYIEFTFELSNTFICDRFFYLYTNNCRDIILDIITTAHNYSAYCSDSLTPTSVNTRNMYKNFVNAISPIFDEIENFKNSDDFKKIELYILESKLGKDKENYISSYDFKNNIHIEICTLSNNIAKLSIYNRYIRYVIYINRGAKGYAALRLILELIKNKEKIYP